MSDAPNTDPRVALASKRTTLASFRTAQALDRTTLAWVRTTFTNGEFWLRDDRLFSNPERAPSDSAIRQTPSRGYPLWRMPGPRGTCSDRISGHFTLEHASPHGAWRNAEGGPLAIEHNGCAVCRAAVSGRTVVGAYLALSSHR